MTDAEVLCFALVSAMLFSANHSLTRNFLKSHGYIPNILSESQLNRRLHRFDEAFWNRLLQTLARVIEEFENTGEYLIDSFPVSSCSNARIFQSKRFKGKEFHSYSSSKKAYFYGIKVHMLATKQGTSPLTQEAKEKSKPSNKLILSLKASFNKITISCRNCKKRRPSLARHFKPELFQKTPFPYDLWFYLFNQRM